MLTCMQAAAALALFDPATATAEQLRRALLVRVPGLVLAIVLITIGLSSIGLYFGASSRRDRSLLWFGVFATLYGLRLSDFVDIVAFLARRPEPQALYLASAVNSFVPIPAILFLRSTASRFRRWINIALLLQSAFFCVAVAADLLLHRPFALSEVNSILVLADLLVLFVVLLSQPRRRGEIFLTFAVLQFLAAIAFTNLRELGLVHFDIRPEPYTFFVLIVALGLYTARSSVQREERLAVLNSELRTARDIQSTLLPGRLPHTAEVRVAARYLPMTDVAGDLYDILQTSSGFGVLIADVTGHGMPAALIASMVKIAARSQLQHARDPAAVLRGMDAILSGQVKGQLVTAAYLYIDTLARSVRYSAAGHPSCLRLDLPGGTTVDELAENDLPLGLGAGDYRARELPLKNGSRFVLYTDGALEALGPADALFGDERLQAAVATTAAMNAEDAAEAIVSRVREWAEGGSSLQPDDDLTLVVVDLL